MLHLIGLATIEVGTLVMLLHASIIIRRVSRNNDAHALLDRAYSCIVLFCIATYTVESGY